jgi:hypothetical protein
MGIAANTVGFIMFACLLGLSVAQAPTVEATPNRELALALEYVTITGTNFGDQVTVSVTEIQVNSKTAPAGSFTQDSTTSLRIHTSWLELENLWIVGTALNVTVKLSSAESSGAAIVGIASTTPTITNNAHVYATNTITRVKVTGENLGATLDTADITSVKVGSVVCSAISDFVANQEFLCTLASGISTAGDSSVSVVLKGGFVAMTSSGTKFAAATGFNTGSDSASYLATSTSQYVITVISAFDATGFTVNDVVGLSILDVANRTITCTPKVISTNLVCELAVGVFLDTSPYTLDNTISVQGMVGGAQLPLRVVGFLHADIPSVTFSDQPPLVGLRESTISFTSTSHLHPSTTRNSFTVQFGGGSGLVCNQTSATSCTLSNPVVTDHAFGTVQIVAIHTNSLDVTLTSPVTVATVLTPQHHFVELNYPDGVIFDEANVTAIKQQLDSDLSLGPDDLRIVLSAGPNSKARATSFLDISSATTNGQSAMTSGSFADSTNNAVTKAAPGVTSVASIQAPTSSPSAPVAATIDPTPTHGASIAPTDEDNSLAPSGLTQGGIAGVVISCIIGVGIIVTVVFLIVNDRSTAKSSEPKNSTVATSFKSTASSAHYSLSSSSALSSKPSSSSSPPSEEDEDEDESKSEHSEEQIEQEAEAKPKRKSK